MLVSELEKKPDKMIKSSSIAKSMLRGMSSKQEIVRVGRRGQFYAASRKMSRTYKDFKHQFGAQKSQH